MKAYLLKSYGKPSSLKIHDVSEPEPGPNQVKVKVRCIGLNYAEILSRRGQYQWAPKKPYIPGMEASGTIAEVGSDVRGYRIGDEVIVGVQYGAYAEYVVAPDHLIFPAMKGFSAEENAALLVNFMTAWVAMVRLGRIVPQDHVLIHAAAGGVGTAAVQIAKSFGATVYGTASKPSKLELIRALGADHAIDYTKEDFEQVIRAQSGGVDLVLEVVGGEVFKKSVKLLNPFGRLVVIGFASISLKKWNPITWWQTWRDAPKVNVIKMATGSYGIMATHIGYLTSNKDIAHEQSKEMMDHVKQHRLKPHVGKVFPFDRMEEAHRFIESRESVGKVVLRI